MATLNIELYEALKEAKVSDAMAKAAATAIAEGPVRIGRVEDDISIMKGDIGTLKNDVQVLKSDMLLLKWMVGFNLAMSVGVFWKTMKV